MTESQRAIELLNYFSNTIYGIEYWRLENDPETNNMFRETVQLCAIKALDMAIQDLDEIESILEEKFELSPADVKLSSWHIKVKSQISNM
jgi:hypothetical protein